MTTATDTTVDEQRALDEIRIRLLAKFPQAEPSAIDAAVIDAHRRFDGRNIRDFVPLFVERSANAALAYSTQA